MAPRGIVAAAVSALFALELVEADRAVPELVPVTFIVIVVTVIYSAVAARVGARRFRVARPAPRGVAFIGGPSWAIELAGWLADHEIPTLVVSHDSIESREAASRGVLTYTGQMDSEDLELALESVGVGTAIAVSRLPVQNAMGIQRATASVGRANVFYLPLDDDEDDNDSSMSAVIARRPFGRGATQTSLDRRHASGDRIAAVSHDTFDKDRLDDAIPLLELPPDGAPAVVVGQPDKAPPEGTVRLYLVGQHVDGGVEAEHIPASPHDDVHP